MRALGWCIPRGRGEAGSDAGACGTRWAGAVLPLAKSNPWACAGLGGSFRCWGAWGAAPGPGGSHKGGWASAGSRGGRGAPGWLGAGRAELAPDAAAALAWVEVSLAARGPAAVPHTEGILPAPPELGPAAELLGKVAACRRRRFPPGHGPSPRTRWDRGLLGPGIPRRHRGSHRPRAGDSWGETTPRFGAVRGFRRTWAPCGALTLSHSAPRGVTGFSAGTEARGEPGSCLLLPTRQPCIAASSLAQPLPRAAMSCGVAVPGSATGLCCARAWWRPSGSGGRGGPSEGTVVAGADRAADAGRREPGCCAAPQGTGLCRLFRGGDQPSRGCAGGAAPLRSPGSVCRCACAPETPGAAQGRSSGGRRGAADPPMVCKGPCPAPRPSSWLSQWLFSICTNLSMGFRSRCPGLGGASCHDETPPPADAVLRPRWRQHCCAPTVPFLTPNAIHGAAGPDSASGLSAPRSWASSPQHRSRRQPVPGDRAPAGREEEDAEGRASERRWRSPGLRAGFLHFRHRPVTASVLAGCFGGVAGGCSPAGTRSLPAGIGPPGLASAGLAREQRPASRLPSIHLVVALSRSSFWLFPSPASFPRSVSLGSHRCGTGPSPGSADPGGQDSGAPGRVVPSKRRDNSAHRLLLPYFCAGLASGARHGCHGIASAGECPVPLFWGGGFGRLQLCVPRAGCLCQLGGAQWFTGARLRRPVPSGVLRGPCSPASPGAFSMGAVAARGTCWNSRDEALTASGACSPCSLPWAGRTWVACPLLSTGPRSCHHSRGWRAHGLLPACPGLGGPWPLPVPRSVAV